MFVILSADGRRNYWENSLSSVINLLRSLDPENDDPRRTENTEHNKLSASFVCYASHVALMMSFYYFFAVKQSVTPSACAPTDAP